MKSKTNTNTTHKNNNTNSKKKHQEERRKTIVNWHDYCVALSRRGDFLYFLDSATKLGAFEKVTLTHERSRPTEYSDTLITLILIYREIYHQPLRQAVKFTRLVLLSQGIKNAVPSYVTVCRRAKDLKIKILPPEYCLRAGDNICYCLDSSGFKVSGEGEWFRRKWGKQKARTFMESHVGINSDDRMILSVINTDCNVHDNTQLLPSLIATERNLSEIGITQKLKAIVLDGAYDKHTNYALAKNLGARLIAPPPINATIHMHKDKDIGKFVDDVGWEDRNEVVKTIKYRGGLEKWKEDTGYHRRSINENVFFRYKTIFGDRMMNRTKVNCKTEQLIRIRILNEFTMLGLPKYEEAIA